VVSSWTKFVSESKTRLSAIARSCFLGRKHWFKKYQKTKQLLEKLQQEKLQWEASRKEFENRNSELQKQISDLEFKLSQPQLLKLPLGEVPPGQQFGAGMIALCVNLARKIGMRPTVRALNVIFEWMDTETRVPTFQTIRGWMQRIGLARMENVKNREGGVWLTDHTNQIGQDKVLVVMRVRSSRVPQPGASLRHQDMEVLALVPGREWKREDVAEVYQETANRYGVPRVLESDGAVELREPAETLGKPRKRPLVIRDPKHFLANQFESLLKRDPQYDAFTKQFGGTRSALQQTELAHFIPPGFKLKARFMNMAPILNWASAILWHLDHLDSQSREGITENRMNEKLGWVRDFRSSIRRWQETQEVISMALKFLNTQGIFRGAVKEFQNLVAGLATSRMGQQLVRKVVEFLRDYEQKLRPGERLPMSTEIVESSFSLYKQLEQQHSKSGFTSLLLTFPTLLRKTNTNEVKACFARVKVADVKAWVKKHLPNTLTSRRNIMYREARTKTKKKIKTSATPLLAAA
jgi:hypothetical protein